MFLKYTLPFFVLLQASAYLQPNFLLTVSPDNSYFHAWKNLPSTCTVKVLFYCFCLCHGLNSQIVFVCCHKFLHFQNWSSCFFCSPVFHVVSFDSVLISLHSYSLLKFCHWNFFSNHPLCQKHLQLLSLKPSDFFHMPDFVAFTFFP